MGGLSDEYDDMNDEQKYTVVIQRVVAISAALLILLLVVAWVVSKPALEWRKVQREYAALVEGMPDSLVQFSARIERGLHEYAIDGLHRTDRCITCHMGMENPAMAGAPQPHTAHPAGFFEHHPPEDFGCTVCHHGQGRALTSADAHASDPEVRWDRPMLSQPFIQSTCGTCHLSVFSLNAGFEGAETFLEGQEIFNREGCLGCHKARGVGGIIGPDLTEQGEKTRSDYDFQHITSEQTVSNWLKEHFRDPEMVSPGSQMLAIDLPEAELDALSTFVLGLTRPEIDLEYFTLNTLEEFKGERAGLQPEMAFGMTCSACHGKSGEGKDYQEYETGVPAIGFTDFRRVVSQDYIEFTLLRGRSRRQMAVWSEDQSGLRQQEMQALVARLKRPSSRLNRPSGYSPPFDLQQFRTADSEEGGRLFVKHCATCHGEQAKGGLALALQQEDLLKNASDSYLFETLVTGRGNAGMPAWENLTDEQVYAVVKYLRSWFPYAPEVPGVSFGDADVADGRLKYRFLCSRCHGEAGQGQTGPAIINRDFLAAADDVYLYHVVAFGRDHSAMFGWSTDVYNAERLDRTTIGNIVKYMREEAADRPDYIHAGRNPGNSATGRALYWKHCTDCHGEQGEGESAPALNNQEFLNAASNGTLVATLTVGRGGTRMPAWGMETDSTAFLSGVEREHIVSYLRNWQRINIKFNREK